MAQTGEISVCLRLRGVEQRVPAAFISDTELRFMTPDFQARDHAEIASRYEIAPRYARGVQARVSDDDCRRRRRRARLACFWRSTGSSSRPVPIWASGTRRRRSLGRASSAE